MRKTLFSLLGILLLLAGLGSLLILSQRDIPAPTGTLPVGRLAYNWSDDTRDEQVTPEDTDRRQVPVQVFYPAEEGTGQPDAYLPDLARLSETLISTGELSTLEAAGLRLIRTTRRQNATVKSAGAPWPVVLLSPGYGTNVAFYACLAEDLASHGFIVVGIDHPYDVGAVCLADGSVAGLTTPGFGKMEEHIQWIRERGPVRVADALFVLKQLERCNQDSGHALFQKLNLEQVGIMGHSLGGITAAEVAATEPRIKAAINLDGIQAGGMLAMTRPYQIPRCPFLMLTKNTEPADAIDAQLLELQHGAWRVVLPGAAHENFSDGPVLQPGIIPGESQADRILQVVRDYTRAFLTQSLRGESSPLLQQPTQSENLRVEIYPTKVEGSRSQ